MGESKRGLSISVEEREFDDDLWGLALATRKAMENK
jgi:hypothetical protein